MKSSFLFVAIILAIGAVVPGSPFASEVPTCQLSEPTGKRLVVQNTEFHFTEQTCVEPVKVELFKQKPTAPCSTPECVVVSYFSALFANDQDWANRLVFDKSPLTDQRFEAAHRQAQNIFTDHSVFLKKKYRINPDKQIIWLEIINPDGTPFFGWPATLIKSENTWKALVKVPADSPDYLLHLNMNFRFDGPEQIID